MAGRLKGSLTEKVDEIKRMQANWLRERSLNIDGMDSIDETPQGGAGRKSRDNARKSAPTNNKTGSETMSWSTGNHKKNSHQPPTNSSTKKNTMRTRSASPSRSSSKPSKNSISLSASSTKRHGSRPSSAKSTTSEGSRPPSGRNVPSSRSEKSTRTDHERRVNDDRAYSGSRDRKKGEPGMYANPNWNDRGSHGDDGTMSSRLQGDVDNYDGARTNVMHASEHAQQTVDDKCLVGDAYSRVDGSESERRTRPKPALDPDAFDRLADQIASRVKAEIKDERQELMNRSGYPQGVLDEPDDDTGYIEGHHCGKCKQLMVPPDHSATLLVPCGHTLCEACAEDRIKCPTCRTRVTSTSPNSTLQELISSSRPNSGARPLNTLSNHRTPDVNQNHVSMHSTNHNPESHRPPQYMPSRYANDGQVMDKPLGRDHSVSDALIGCDSNSSDSRMRESKNAGSEKADVARSRRKMSPEEEARKMEDEYQSLGIRCEALESEEADVLERVEKQNTDIAKHKQQMGNIAQKQQHLREEIKGLEKRLADLEGHRQEYKRQVEDAEDRKKEELDQLAMVRTMLRDMQRNRERVKMSARKLNISLD
ncbi:uncharacterized protein LOC121426404 [Lytechinus variegatus]|uniref:uncharacterized protein LOC121426404 n=1 Tax=Lytechinus variegatus TaxID=7654 RepID=UPI001BB1C404|nr:uncharacterized protein LOC121426404 [Lytechinus variegatus]